MSSPISNNPSPSTNTTYPEDAIGNLIINNPNNEVNESELRQPSNQSTPSATYSEAQSGNFIIHTQKSILFSKLAEKEKTANAASPTASAAPTKSAGVSVNIADVKKVISANENGKRAANQGIRTSFEVSADGTKRPLSSSELAARANRDQFLKLTDGKGNLTPLGKQFSQIKANDSAVVTELGTDIHQLATLVNGGVKPSPEREATIIAGLVSKGLASVAVDDKGKINFNIVPYRAAANIEILAAGEQAKTDFENIRKILPGLKNIQGIVTVTAGTYAAAFVGVIAAPAGGLIASTASALTGQTVENVFKDGRLPTAQEAATAIVLDRLTAGGGYVVGKVFNKIKDGVPLSELPISPSTTARNTESQYIEPTYQTIFEGNVPRPVNTNPVVSAKEPARAVSENELKNQYQKALLLQKSISNLDQTAPSPVINQKPTTITDNVEVKTVKPVEVKKAEVSSTNVVTKTELSAVEKAAKAKALEIEKLDGGHSIDRHGPEIPLEALEKRLTQGIAPDNRISYAPASTKFNSYENWVKTRQTALKEIEVKYNIDLSKPPGPNDEVALEIRVEFNKPIDDGYVPDVSTKINKMVQDPTTGVSKQTKVFTSVDFIEGVTGTYTKIAWVKPDPLNPGNFVNASRSEAGQWTVVQHFPLAKDWDNVTKSYKQTLDVKTTLP